MFFSFNISSLPKHGGELTCVLSNLKTQFDILILTEIGAKNISTVEKLFDEYDFFYVLPVNCSRGGVGMYIHKSIADINILNVGLIQSCDCLLCKWECLCIEISFNNTTFVLCGIYRHPNGNIGHFTSDLDILLNTLGRYKSVIIAGDINIDLMKFEIDGIMNYISSLLSQRYLPFITLPTRITSHSATCIDHIFFKQSTPSLDSVSGIFYCDISDHLPCFISIVSGKACNNSKRPLIRLFSEKNNNIFIERMNAMNWDEIYTPDIDWCEAFVVNVKRIYELSFPLVQLSRKRAKDKPWMTKGLKICCKINNRLFKRTLRSDSIHTFTKYKKCKNSLRRRLEEAEIKYYEQIFSDNKKSTFNLWKRLGPILNPGRKRDLGINKILHNGEMIDERHVIPDVMNDYFCNIGLNLQQRLPTSNINFKRYLPEKVVNSFYLSPVNQDDVCLEITKMNPRKATGPDDISSKLVQLCPNIFASNLTKIYNNAIANAEYPIAMKIAKVIALFKKGEKHVTGNYRPISLLTCFNKIFEKLICKKLLKFLDINNILYTFQFGFRNLHSTTLALI